MLAGGGLPAAERIAIYLDFDGTPSPASVELMKSEAARLVEPAGFPVEWRLLGTRGQNPVRGLVVVRLTGSCSAEGISQPMGSGRLTLGSTAVVEGHVLPYCRIECDAVRQFLAGWPCGRISKETQYGQALGHVLAHELYHALLRTTHHHSAGFTKAIQRPQDLRPDDLWQSESEH